MFTGGEEVVGVRDLLLVGVTEMGVFVFAGHAAAAAVGESESAEGRPVQGGFLGHGNLHKLDWGIGKPGGRKSVPLGKLLYRESIWKDYLLVK